MNLADNLVRSAAQFSDHPAVRLDDVLLTYADLDRCSSRVAALLGAHGVRPGDRVGVMLPNVPEFAAVYYGVLRAGGVVVPMNPLLKEREVAYYLSDSQARLFLAWHACGAEAVAGAARTGTDCVVVDSGFLDSLPQADSGLVADRDGADTAVILYTSGTTGHPKGAELTHANLGGNVEVVSTDLLELGPGDVVFGGLPLFHSFGQTCGLNAAVRTGACLTLVSRFAPEKVFTVLARDRVTVFEGVPTMYVALLTASSTMEFDALRLCVSGGAALPAEVLRAFEERFGCVILEGYGLSETSPVASFNQPGRVRKVGSIGTPIRGVEMKLVDADGKDMPVADPGEVGEIAIRGHNVMKGYWRRPEATTEAIPDGWFRTGDLARRDDEGYYFIVDRKKELIIRGGYNVYPREVEEVLYEHPSVVEAAVVGVPDALHGEEVCAAVVLRPGARETVEDLQAYVKAQVAAYKYPRRIWLLDELPKGPTGKILKREIQPPDGL
jgi:long-chain acyl-CoA synthetase